MIPADRFLGSLASRGAGPFFGVPCSILKPFINYVIDSPDLEYYAANNEGEAVAMAAGARLAGRSPVVMLQNSGLGNTVNPLSSLHYIFRIPVLLIITWRGEPGRPDAPQHELMGQITHELLSTLRIEHAPFPEEDGDVDGAVDKALAHMESTSLPYAFIMRKGAVEPYALQSRERGSWPNQEQALPVLSTAKPVLTRRQAIEAVRAQMGTEAFYIGTTGMTGRELYTLEDRPNHLYMVGSMGCACSLGLGIALSRPDLPMVILDGDGAVLMRLESLASVGRYRPARFLHVLLDNEVHDSTGGQRTLSDGFNFPLAALAAGYGSVASVAAPDDFSGALEAAAGSAGPHFIHLKVLQGSTPDLGRPPLTMPEYGRRFLTALTNA